MRNLRVIIRRNADGVLAGDAWSVDEFCSTMWEWGNYACDCNRELMFCRARGDEEPDEPACGDGRYSAKVVDADTGEVLYSDFG